MLLRVHPDKFGGDSADSEAKANHATRLCTEAWELLSDRDQRQQWHCNMTRTVQNFVRMRMLKAQKEFQEEQLPKSKPKPKAKPKTSSAASSSASSSAKKTAEKTNASTAASSSASSSAKKTAEKTNAASSAADGPHEANGTDKKAERIAVFNLFC